MVKAKENTIRAKALDDQADWQGNLSAYRLF